MRIFRWLTILSAVAAAGVAAIRLVTYVTSSSPVACVATNSGTGSHETCYGPLDGPLVAILIFYIGLQAVLLLVGVIWAIFYAQTRQRVVRRVLWVLAIVLVAFTYLASTNFILLPSALILFAAAVFSIGIQPAVPEPPSAPA